MVRAVPVTDIAITDIVITQCGVRAAAKSDIVGQDTVTDLMTTVTDLMTSYCRRPDDSSRVLLILLAAPCLG